MATWLTGRPSSGRSRALGRALVPPRLMAGHSSGGNIAAEVGPATLRPMDRSLLAVLLGTLTLRFSTGLTGLMLTFYLAHLDEYHGVADQVLGLGQGQPVGPIAFAMVHATFYAAELVFSPLFGVLSDRLGHHRVMQFGPVFRIVPVVATWATTNLPIIGATRLLQGCATAASVPSILGYIAAVTAAGQGLPRPAG